MGESLPDWAIIRDLARSMGVPMNYASPAEIMKEIRQLVPLYRSLAEGSCWPAEHSPIHGAIADLSLASASIMTREVITAGRLLFSSGVMTTRSKELASLSREKVQAAQPH